VNVLFDTNVILDVLLEREPFVDAASKLFALVDNGRITGSICATTVTTVFYVEGLRPAPGARSGPRATRPVRRGAGRSRRSRLGARRRLLGL